MKLGVWRLRGIDRREDARWLSLKNKGVDVLFHETSAGTGGWQHSQVPRCTFKELLECDIINMADEEITEKVENTETKALTDIIDFIPENKKIILNVYTPTSLEKYSNVIKERVSVFLLNWRMPIPAGFPYEKLHLIKHAMDNEYWKPNPDFKREFREAGTIFITFIAEVLYTKGFGELISALIKSNHINKKIKLVVAGKDPAFAAQYYANKFPGVIFYQGFSPKWDDVKYILYNSDVYCQPNITNQGSHGLQEAMSCGLPLLTIDNGFMEREFIDDGKNGYVCKDWKELGTRFIELAENMDEISVMGENSRIKALKDYDGNVIASKILDIIRKI